jgi:hypothetical protein
MGKVSTDQDDVVAFRQFCHALIKICDPTPGYALRDSQGNGVKPGPDTHGSHVAQVHGQGFVTHLSRPAPLFAKVDILQEQIGAESPVFSSAFRMKDGRIVSNPLLQRNASASKPVPQQADDLVFAPGCWPRLPVRSDFGDHRFTTKTRRRKDR